MCVKRETQRDWEKKTERGGYERVLRKPQQGAISQSLSSQRFHEEKAERKRGSEKISREGGREKMRAREREREREIRMVTARGKERITFQSLQQSTFLSLSSLSLFPLSLSLSHAHTHTSLGLCSQSCTRTRTFYDVCLSPLCILACFTLPLTLACFTLPLTRTCT